MAKAMRCDRCGKYYDKNTVRINVLDLHRTIVTTGVGFLDIDGTAFNGRDLCDNCINALVEFLKPVEAGPDD